MVDFITKLLLVAEKDAILVVCNKLSKIAYFAATTEGTTVEGLAQLFKYNVQKLHGLLESVISDQRPQFVTELTRELNSMLVVEIRLSTHPQIDRQTKYINQEPEQYLQFFVDQGQKDLPEWLVSTEFVVNSKVYLVTEVSPLKANQRRKVRMGADIRRKEKMKRQADRGRREIEM